ncbi:hypothetical protein ACFZAU_02650 [Streptomyces sp. NPDC008238]
MSAIVEFFVAPGDETAAAVVVGGPGGAFESLKYGNFDAEEALIEWEGIVTGRSFGELVDAGVPEPSPPPATGRVPSSSPFPESFRTRSPPPTRPGSPRSAKRGSGSGRRKGRCSTTRS